MLLNCASLLPASVLPKSMVSTGSSPPPPSLHCTTSSTSIQLASIDEEVAVDDGEVTAKCSFFIFLGDGPPSTWLSRATLVIFAWQFIVVCCCLSLSPGLCNYNSRRFCCKPIAEYKAGKLPDIVSNAMVSFSNKQRLVTSAIAACRQGYSVDVCYNDADGWYAWLP
jgi:hypothetical protein